MSAKTAMLLLIIFVIVDVASAGGIHILLGKREILEDEELEYGIIFKSGDEVCLHFQVVNNTHVVVNNTMPRPKPRFYKKKNHCPKRGQICIERRLF